MTQINKTLNQIERGFNIGGSIPLIGTIPAAIRVSLGGTQFNLGLVVGGVGLLGQLILRTLKNGKT